MTGAAGFETAVFAGARSGYAVSIEAGVTTVADIDLDNGDDGTDTISLFDALKFSDTTLTLQGGVWG